MAERIERIKACLNGGRGRDEHPAVPVTPAELAAEAAAAVSAGAEAVHLHPRSGGGAESLLGADVGAAARWRRILVEITDVPATGAVAAASEILGRLDELGVAAPRLLHGEQAGCWPLVARAGELGLPTRIGLEDTTVGPEGAPVSGNAELTRLARHVWAVAARG